MSETEMPYQSDDKQGRLEEYATALNAARLQDRLIELEADCSELNALKIGLLDRVKQLEAKLAHWKRMASAAGLAGNKLCDAGIRALGELQTLDVENTQDFRWLVEALGGWDCVRGKEDE